MGDGSLSPEEFREWLAETSNDTVRNLVQAAGSGQFAEDRIGSLKAELKKRSINPFREMVATGRRSNYAPEAPSPPWLTN